MVKQKFQKEQKDITLVVIEDSSSDKEVNPWLDLCWTKEVGKVDKQYSPLYESPIYNPIECPFEEPIISPQESSKENIYASTGAGTYQEISKLQKKIKKLRRVAKENSILIRVIQEQNSRYKEKNLKQQNIIEKWERKYKKSKAKVGFWTKKFKFQRAKVAVLKKKIKVLREQASPSGTRLTILENGFTLY